MTTQTVPRETIRRCKCGEPATTGGQCRECHAAYMRRWRAAGREQVLDLHDEQTREEYVE